MKQNGLSLSNKEYLALADDTGRQWPRRKLGRISPKVRSIITELKVDPNQWQEQVRVFSKSNVATVGPLDRLVLIAFDKGRHWSAGYSLARKVYRAALCSDRWKCYDQPAQWRSS
ncbi:hypothetical protein C7S18_19900 [Ahniella affigens]|uniref:Transposase n=1 Tax=Ahniella affigens TaxID=2021234 RepID=A0A2P1PWR0_9GAMM|nr:hypothetical protein [Ahniella affigens]AVP99291.1 hypothetical protein C7S18_19900 [Ahniella affigens]